MQYHDASLLKTAAREDQWPVSDLPEIIFAGRSNAGKSSLINALVNRKNLAYAGSTPGKTRLLNFFSVDQKVVFTDAPGYGYATSDKAAAASFSRLIDPYFHHRPQLKALVLVLDARREPGKDDIAMIEYARDAHLAVVIAATKADKLSRGAMANQKFKIAKALQVTPQSIYPVDSLKKTGLDEVWTRLNEIISQRF